MLKQTQKRNSKVKVLALAAAAPVAIASLSFPLEAQRGARAIALNWKTQTISNARAARLLGQDELVVSQDRSQWRIRRSDGGKVIVDCQVHLPTGTVPYAMSLKAPDGSYIVSTTTSASGVTASWLAADVPTGESASVENAAWTLVFAFASGVRETRARMTERGQKGEVQCWGLATAANRTAEQGTPSGKPDYQATCERQ
jgi:hypothetical protein